MKIKDCIDVFLSHNADMTNNHSLGGCLSIILLLVFAFVGELLFTYRVAADTARKVATEVTDSCLTNYFD